MVNNNYKEKPIEKHLWKAASHSIRDACLQAHFLCAKELTKKR